MKSGDYGHPPNVNWWKRQTIAFICCLFVMKFMVVTIFRLFPVLFDIGEWLLGWTLYNAKLQVVFVMLIFPLVMNILQFWLVDQVIKKKLESVKLENDDFGIEEVFLSGELNEEEEINYDESLSSYKGDGGSSVSISSNTAILARETFSSDKNIFSESDDTFDDRYIELRKTPSPNIIRDNYFEK